MASLPSLFPYEPRPGQADLVAFLRAGADEGRHVVVESGTGTGKTVSALVAALSSARASGRRVVYLTRTNSQARQVMVEARAIAARSGERRLALALQGRHHLCPLRQQEAELAAADSEELALMCKDRMKAAEDEVAGRKPKHVACPFHLRGLVEGNAGLAQWVREELPDAEALAARVAAAGRCPHVLTRNLLLEAELVVAPYNYILSPFLRGAFLRWLGASLADIILVVDEAHNLPAQARELATARLTRTSIERAIAETRAFGDPVALGAIPLSRVLRAVDDAFAEVAESHLPEGSDDALLPPEEFDVILLSSLRTATPALDRALALMDEYAVAVRESRRREGKVPRSYVGSVAAFLRAFRGLDVMTHAPIVERDGGGVALVAYALDPSVVTECLADASATLHLSGTLRPMDEYVSSVGLDPARTSSRAFPSPFPEENRLVVVDESVTTRHEEVVADPQAWEAIGRRLQQLRAATERNMAVFLPSYEVLHKLSPYLRGRGSFVEARGEAQDATMARLAQFKATRGATLLSVIGGRLSEGMDFPDEELEVVVIVGLPYARPSAKGEALLRFYERRFGKGWEWAVKVPMTRRVLQAAGRLIRTPTDRGVVVLLDRRAAMLREHIPRLRTSTEPASLLRAFFGSGIPSYGADDFTDARNLPGPPSGRP